MFACSEQFPEPDLQNGNRKRERERERKKRERTRKARVCFEKFLEIIFVSKFCYFCDPWHDSSVWITMDEIHHAFKRDLPSMACHRYQTNQVLIFTLVCGQYGP